MTDAWQTYFVKVNANTHNHVSVEELTNKIRSHVNTGDAYFKEIEFTEFDTMTGSIRQCTRKSRLMLVDVILFNPNFRLRELVFTWYFLHTFKFLHKL